MAKIPMRTVRVDGPLWTKFIDRVRSRGQNGSAILRAAIYLYCEDDDNSAALEEAVAFYGTLPVYPGRPAQSDASATGEG